MGAGAISEDDLRCDAIGEREAIRNGRDYLSGNMRWHGIEKKAEKVEKVAGFSKNPAATLSIVGIPLLWIEAPCENAVRRGLGRRRRGDAPFEFDGGRSESAIEANLNTSLASGERHVYVFEFRPGKAQRFLDKDVTVGEKRRLYQGAVQMMASRNEERRGFCYRFNENLVPE